MPHSDTLSEPIDIHNKESNVEVFMLIHESSGHVIHVGPKSECELIMGGFREYMGDKADDKFFITSDKTLTEEG